MFKTFASAVLGAVVLAAPVAASVNVDDFLADNGQWTLKVKQGGWVKGTDGTDVATGNAANNGKAIDLGAYALNVAAGTNVNRGTYTNMLTWSLSNIAGNTTK